LPYKQQTVAAAQVFIEHHAYPEVGKFDLMKLHGTESFFGGYGLQQAPRLEQNDSLKMTFLPYALG